MPALNLGRTAHRLLFLLFCGICLSFVLSFTNITDEAYLTYRVVDNAVQGYGLRWNVDERVQVYNHPLWMLAHIPFYALVPSAIAITIGLSLICGVIAVTLLLKTGGGSHIEKALLLLAPLTLAAAQGNMAITGMETPLSLVLIAWFIHELWRAAGPRSHYLYLIAALTTITRFDGLFLLLPTLLLYGKTTKGLRNYGKIALAIMPALLWYGFSILYYGFAFPNSDAARLSVNMERMDYVIAGLQNMGQHFFYDNLTFVWIAIALIYGACLAYKGALRKELILLLVGIALHVGYIVYIGGDLPPGRRLAPSFFTAVFVIYILLRKTLSGNVALLLMGLFNLYVLSIGLHYSWVRDVMSAGAQYNIRDIEWLENAAVATSFRSLSSIRALMDLHEGLFQFIRTGLLILLAGYIIVRGRFNHSYKRIIPLILINFYIASLWLEYSTVQPARPTPTKTPAIITQPSLPGVFIISRNIGMSAYYAGNAAIIINKYGQTDALLARLGNAGPGDWHQGIFARHIPDGYLEARRSGDIEGMSEPLARYYERLELLTAVPVFDLERLAYMLGFQLWWYDAYRYKYMGYDLRDEIQKAEQERSLRYQPPSYVPPPKPFPMETHPAKKQRIKRHLTP